MTDPRQARGDGKRTRSVLWCKGEELSAELANGTVKKNENGKC